MNAKAKLLLQLLVAAGIELIVYIFLHESGHALVAVCCGAEIVSFQIIGASVTSVGGTYTPFTESLRLLAGMALPLLVSACYMLFVYRNNKTGQFYRIFSIFFSITPILSLLAWVLVPFAYLAGDTNASDDVIQFLNASALHPLLVVLLALVLLCGLMLLFWKKRLPQAWLDLICALKKQSPS